MSKKKTLTIPLPNATALLLSAATKSYISAKALRDSSHLDTSLHEQVSFGSDGVVFDYYEHCKAYREAGRRPGRMDVGWALVRSREVPARNLQNGKALEGKRAA